MNHESWCDTSTGISTRCNCIASEYIDEIESLEEKLAIAVEAMWFSLRGIAMWEKYQSPGNMKEIKTAMREALEKIKGGAE